MAKIAESTEFKNLETSQTTKLDCRPDLDINAVLAKKVSELDGKMTQKIEMTDSVDLLVHGPKVPSDLQKEQLTKYT